MADEEDIAPIEVMRAARDELTELTGLKAETVSRLESTEDGWLVQVEVLELARIPETMSLLSTYEVTLTKDGQLSGYQRIRRYERGKADKS
ncbi:gas vesicle protein GvpO [Streptomyces sp. NPDC054796]|uniref:Gas vesicle protein n=1 Tax=Streptomyces daliensis TaxID=299421 RepID=A0A8T4ILQ9_9ACTN|nr:gas vesicle protein [Streptomyces daliensis]